MQFRLTFFLAGRSLNFEHVQKQRQKQRQNQNESDHILCSSLLHFVACVSARLVIVGMQGVGTSCNGQTRERERGGREREEERQDTQLEGWATRKTTRTEHIER